MKILLSSGSINSNLEDLFKLVSRNDLNGIEWVIPKLNWQPDYNLFEDLEKKHNIKIRNVHAFFYSPHLFRSFLLPNSFVSKLIQEAADFGSFVGADKIIVHPFPALFFPEKIKQIMRNVLERIKKKYQVDIFIENLEKRKIFFLGVEPYCISDYDELYYFAEQHNFYLNLDTSHCITKNISPLDFFKRYYKRVKGIHISNFNNKCHSSLNEGIINFKDFFALLKEYGYEETVTLELDRRKIAIVQDNINLLKEYIYG